jgi:phage baseplate assembly protein W
MSTFREEKFTPVQAQRDLFSDIFTSFSVHPELHDLVIRRNEESIKQAINNLILTNKYERPFNPNFGCNLRKYLFEPMNSFTASSIENEIKMSIENYEPRVRLIDVVATPFEKQNAYAVTVEFYIVNSSVPVTLTTLLYRVR